METKKPINGPKNPKFPKVEFNIELDTASQALLRSPRARAEFEEFFNRKLKTTGFEKPITIARVNGFNPELLEKSYPDLNFTGFEKAITLIEDLLKSKALFAAVAISEVNRNLMGFPILAVRTSVIVKGFDIKPCDMGDIKSTLLHLGVGLVSKNIPVMNTYHLSSYEQPYKGWCYYITTNQNITLNGKYKEIL